MLTKKVFIAAAKNIASFDFNSEEDKEKAIQISVDIFKAANPRFDEDRFREACKSL